MLIIVISITLSLSLYIYIYIYTKGIKYSGVIYTHENNVIFEN